MVRVTNYVCYCETCQRLEIVDEIRWKKKHILDDILNDIYSDLYWDHFNECFECLSVIDEVGLRLTPQKISHQYYASV